jgi:hypothetical protein
MKKCSSLFASVRDCSQVFGLFALFATVLYLYNEQSNSSPLRIPLEDPTPRERGLGSLNCNEHQHRFTNSINQQRMVQSKVSPGVTL